jgi:hypothetical protein
MHVPRRVSIGLPADALAPGAAVESPLPGRAFPVTPFAAPRDEAAAAAARLSPEQWQALSQAQTEGETEAAEAAREAGGLGTQPAGGAAGQSAPSGSAAPPAPQGLPVPPLPPMAPTALAPPLDPPPPALAPPLDPPPPPLPPPPPPQPVSQPSARPPLAAPQPSMRRHRLSVSSSATAASEPLEGGVSGWMSDSGPLPSQPPQEPPHEPAPVLPAAGATPTANGDCDGTEDGSAATPVYDGHAPSREGPGANAAPSAVNGDVRGPVDGGAGSASGGSAWGAPLAASSEQDGSSAAAAVADAAPPAAPRPPPPPPPGESSPPVEPVGADGAGVGGEEAWGGEVGGWRLARLAVGGVDEGGDEPLDAAGEEAAGGASFAAAALKWGMH